MDQCHLELLFKRKFLSIIFVAVASSSDKLARRKGILFSFLYLSPWAHVDVWDFFNSSSLCCIAGAMC